MSRKFIYTSYNSGSLDADAAQFILNWEASTGVSMPTTQRLAVNDLYRGLKGEGTTNNTNFWNNLVLNDSKIYPLVPLDDLNANANAYKLDLVTNGVNQGTYVNFVGGDFLATGVTGGTGKYFDTGIVPNIANSSLGVYDRSNTMTATWEMGAANVNINANTAPASGLITRSNTATIRNRNNNNVTVGTPASAQGLIYSLKFGSQISIIRNNTILTTATTGQTIVTVPMYVHGANNNGTLVSPSAKQLCTYFFKVVASLSNSNERDDWYTIWQRFQSNVISGGRQIGTAIPPI